MNAKKDTVYQNNKHWISNILVLKNVFIFQGSQFNHLIFGFTKINEKWKKNESDVFGVLTSKRSADTQRDLPRLEQLIQNNNNNKKIVFEVS